MKKLFAFFAERHTLATLFVVAIFMLGLASLRTLKRDQFPEVDLGIVVITTTYPGAAPEDVELNVTNKLEDELKNVNGIDEISSVSLENQSVIEIQIDPDVRDQQKVKDDIQDAVSRVTDFPEEVTQSPLITEITTAIFPIIEVGIIGDVPYEELREVARDFRKKLKDIDGVSSLDEYGYWAREVKVDVEPRALDTYQVSLRDIMRAIEARNIRLTGGTFESFTSEKNVVTLAQFREPLEVGDVVVRSTFDGPLIRVRDLAVVREDFKDPDIISRVEGQGGISFVVNKTENADIIRTTNAIKELVRQESAKGNIAGYVETGEPETSGFAAFLNRVRGRPTHEKHIYRYGPVKIIYANDQSVYVKNSFQIVLANGAVGLVLVLVLLTVFLNLRTAFWVGMGIPVAMLGTFFLMPLFGTFLDTISLASLILIIGIIVDDGIIISENIAFRRHMGDSPLDAAVNGVHEVFFPVLTTVLTTFLAFAPMFFLKGILGRFIFVIPLTVSLALFISLIESTIVLPSHLKKGLERAAARNRKNTVPQWFEALKGPFRRILQVLLRGRWAICFAALIVLAGAVFYMQRYMDFILFPTKGADSLWVLAELPQGTSLEGTSTKVREIEAVIEELPEDELQTYITRVGQLEWVGRAENFAQINVRLTPFSQRNRTADQIRNWLEERTGVLEGYETITLFIDAGGPPVGKPISMRVIGYDDELRRSAADEVFAFLQGMDGVRGVDRNDKLGKDQIEIDIDYDRLARLGLTVADVAQNVRIAYDGQVVTSLRQDDEDVDFRVQFTKEARQNERFLENMAVPNAQGRLIRLGDVADLKLGPGPSSYRHFDGERTTTVEADVDTEVTTALDTSMLVMAQFADIGDRYEGVRIEIGGEAQESQEAIFNVMITFAVAFVGIYFLLVLLFNSFWQPFLVMAAVPVGFAGVILALRIHNEPIGFLALIGTIGLAGVVVNDSLVLVNHLNDLRRQGVKLPMRQLVAMGTTNRLRAILLTTMTTVAGLLPLAYGIGGRDLYMAPMALALGYGLLFATPITLLLVPSLYMVFEDTGRFFKWVFGKGPLREQPPE
jgi:multidrug efflux pump subunit AcrB